MIPDGASLMIGGFMVVGTPERVVDEIVRQGKHDLTVIAFPDGRATLLETGPGISVGQVTSTTEADLVVPNDVQEMTLSTVEQGLE
jgi:acyl CoA:acetate/3-ketoacid CoA transferase alpha subunit